MKAPPVRFGLVGCGGMGRRHVAGIAELARAGHASVDLVAVCDRNPDNARFLASEAEGSLGSRPRVFAEISHMVREVPELEAATCTTDVAAHHVVTTELFEAGLHVLCEKPLALTIRAGRQMLDAQRRAQRVLSVAENFRRDPINRLVRALIDDGTIGEPHFVLEAAVRGGNSITITPWRHRKLGGTLPLDVGVHSADILQYYVGRMESASGRVRLLEPRRYKRQTTGPGGFYERWAQDMPDVIEADGEDAMFGLLRFENGAVGQWIDHHAGHGRGFRARQVFGTRGSIEAPGDRNGRPVVVHMDGGVDVGDGAILDLAPSYQLDAVAADLFGSERPWTYDFDFAITDRKLIALEYHELASCVRQGGSPEVDGAAALDAVAMVYSLFESDRVGRSVTLDEVESGAVDAYQRDIDAHLGLVSAGMVGSA
jgi:predicted dehydrogenase